MRKLNKSKKMWKKEQKSFKKNRNAKYQNLFINKSKKYGTKAKIKQESRNAKYKSLLQCHHIHEKEVLIMFLL